jgi:hypothetical protein
VTPAARTVLTAIFWLSVTGLCIFGFTTAENAAAHAYRWVRFHLGPVKPDGAPLNRDEAMALVSARRGWRMPSHPDQAYQRQEDWS